MLSLVKKASVVEANLERICDHFVRITKSIIKADDPTRMDWSHCAQLCFTNFLKVFPTAQLFLNL